MNTITPPQCIGIMGGGQLGRMLAFSAKQMGFRVAILDPDNNCPAKQLANYHIDSTYDDYAGLNSLIQHADVITTEFENVPAKSMEYLSTHVPTHPKASAILIAQDRIREKKFFNQYGIKTTPYCAISNIEDINTVNPKFFPAILKTNQLGYDGKGQIKVNNVAELLAAFHDLNNVPCILEQMVDIKHEVSIIVARNSWEKMAYPVVENIHKNGILDLTIAKAQTEVNLTQIIQEIGLNIIEHLDYIGVLAIEFFITHNNQVLANEMAPRPHNSGHYTLDTCITSQFEQQLRSICNLKLGDSGFKTSAIMLNLLGDIWQNSTTAPDWGKILKQHSNLKLHLYEKAIARSGRKMGHLTIQGANMNKLLQQMEQIKSELEIK
ncbi:MAG: 5-(carboxyamino)imidazole ribonucleotide synthase [Burkholderiales bacterium]|nr:5-(carboxyamino)imidazole ribonucleotide synthase [Burkholderiales bacterium]